MCATSCAASLFPIIFAVLIGLVNLDIAVFATLFKSDEVKCASMCMRGDLAHCRSCAHELIPRSGTIGEYGMTVGYARESLRWLFGEADPRVDYQQLVCGDAFCSQRHYDSFNATYIASHDRIVAGGVDFVRGTDNGTYWRNGQLGLIVSNPFLYQETSERPPWGPLGATPAVHRILRKLYAARFPTSADSARRDTYATMKARIERIVAKHVSSWEQRRHVRLNPVPDVTIMVFEIVCHQFFDVPHLFTGSVAEHDWQQIEFAQYLPLINLLGSYVSLFLTASAYETEAFSVPGVPSLAIRDMASFVTRSYERVLSKISEPGYIGQEELSACGGEHTCLSQVAQQITVILFSAGTLSVSSTIAAGLATLTSTDVSNPFDPIERAAYTPSSDHQQFWWECIRYFPPVVGFPFYTQRPTCVGMTWSETNDLGWRPCPVGATNAMGRASVNVLAGSSQTAYILALGQKDPAVWGEDASKFRLRKLSEYKAHSVGFAEQATDASYLAGTADRVCPGKDAALLIGYEVFRRFDPDTWDSSSARFQGVTPFVVAGSFSALTRPAPRNADAYVFGLAPILLIGVLSLLLCAPRLCGTAGSSAATVGTLPFRWFYIPYAFSSEERSPALYVAAGYEFATIAMAISTLLTLTLTPNQFVDNPILRTLGYNNLCVAWDVRPASGVAVCLWSFALFCTSRGVVAAWKRTRHSHTVTRVWQVVLLRSGMIGMQFGFSIFPIIWVYSPYVSSYAHYGGYLCLLVGVWMACITSFFAFYWTGQFAGGAFATITLLTFTVVTLVNVIMFSVALTSLDAPALSTPLVMMFDYGWFFMSSIVVRFGVLPIY